MTGLKEVNPMRRTIVIDGNKFDDIEGFYYEMDSLLTKDLNWKTGHNFDAFNDLLRGGFGVHEYGEPILLSWINFLYVAPTIINTFLESYDFSGKTIIPFATSDGSGLGKIIEINHVIGDKICFKLLKGIMYQI